MRRIYGFLLRVSWLVISVLALFNAKLMKFVSGRKTALNSKGLNSPIWFHCSSVGEFEQARPLIEEIKKSSSTKQVLVSFFSPSGFDHLSNYELADDVVYTPFDDSGSVKRFLEAYEPSSLILIKYEFWKNLIHFTFDAQIPIYSVCSIFRSDQRFFKSYGAFFRKDLEKIDRFFVQDKESEKLLTSIGIKQCEIIGDTRFDRVIKIAENNKELSSIKEFTSNSSTLVAGSTWLEDEKIISSSFLGFGSEWKLIIAPHEVNNERLESIEKMFNGFKTIRLSGSNTEELAQSNVLIIDSIGLLNRIYRYADFCYVGGAFGAGLHNILEAAVWGKPIVHGPKFDKFKEAKDLNVSGGSVVISDHKSGLSTLTDLSKNENRRFKMGEISKEYVYQNMGATLKVISFLKKEGIF